MEKFMGRNLVVNRDRTVAGNNIGAPKIQNNFWCYQIMQYEY